MAYQIFCIIFRSQLRAPWFLAIYTGDCLCKCWTILWPFKDCYLSYIGYEQDISTSQVSCFSSLRERVSFHI